MTSPESEPQSRRWLAIGLSTLALLFAVAASYRRVVDTDIGWQMATGRYVVEHWQIPRTDVFSYTAQGQEWIYPVGSGVAFYAAERAGGFAAITWIGVLACTTVVLLLLNSGGAATAALALIAVPAVAYSTLPRANMFSTALFAATLFILWRHHRIGHAPLWLLPLLMAAWVNLHPGFFAGLAAIGAYFALDLFEWRRERLRQAAPWLAATVAATLLNPWGVRLYTAITRQSLILETHRAFVTEWSRPKLRISGALDWRGLESTFWWLLFAAAAALALALWRRRFGPALVLAGTIAMALRFERFQGMFAIVVVIVAGAIFAELNRRVTPRLVVPALAVAALFTAVRITDLVTNRYYFVQNELATFGAGPTHWYPERAAAFIVRERLPGRMFNAYDIGGYLMWRLGPDYPTYIDGRAVPFGPDVFFRYMSLLEYPPHSPEWQREAELRGINFAIFPVTRFAGLASMLNPYCRSQSWRAVYVDETAAVFLRNRPENGPWLDRLAVDCATVQLPAPAGDLYNYYANAGWVMYSLGRGAEALAMLDRAAAIFAGDQHLYFMRGAVLQAGGARRDDAIREFETALRLGDNGQARYALGVAYANRGRYIEAAENIRSAARSTDSHDMYRMLGEVYLVLRQPSEALRAFDDAERRSPYRGPSAAGAGFRAQLAIGRAQAWCRLGQSDRALAEQQQAVRLTPWDAARWLELAELYDARGSTADARDARRRAAALQQTP